MAKKITMQAIADELQISKSLVSKALSNKEGINDETKDRIRAAAVKMGYRTNSVSLLATASQTGNVAVLVLREDLNDFEYWGKIVRGIEMELSESAFSMMLSGIDSSLSVEDGMPSCIRDRKVDGVLVLGFVPLPYITALQAMELPIILLDSLYFQMKLDHVLAENYLGGYEATRYLLDRNHQRIGFVGDPSYAQSFADRYRGFATAINDFKRETGKIIRQDDFTGSRGNDVIPFDRSAIREALVQETRPTALVCGNDPVAFEILQMISEAGLSCPKDISVIGFDNLQKCDWVVPQLTSIDACKETMGNRAVQLLFRRMQNPDTRPEHVIITTEVIERKSVSTNP